MRPACAGLWTSLALPVLKKTPKTSTVLIRSASEFAHYVGLSRSAVSRVLNQQPGLRPDTIARVRKAIEETGFTPNAHARHLRGKRTAMIGVCMENFLTPPSVEKLSVIDGLLRSRGYTTLIEVFNPGAGRKLVQHFLGLRVDGIIFIGNFAPDELGQRITELKRHATPHLVIDHLGIKHANSVSVDRAEAMRQVTNHLLDLGHRRFGLLGISGPYQTVTDRLYGIHGALAARGLDIASCTRSLDYLHTRTEHFNYGAVLAQAFARLPDRPTAYLAVNDETAIGALLEFQAQGLRVPEDFSIVGFNNQTICLVTKPNLSSVDHQIAKSMEVAVTTILGQIGRPISDEITAQLIAPKFIVRGSTGPAPRT